jgi:hypothetical protein
MNILIIIVTLITGFVLLFFILQSWVKKMMLGHKFTHTHEEHLSEMMAMMNDTVEQQVSLIELKIKELRSVIDLANRKISLLEKETAKMEQGKQTYNELAKKKPLISSVIDLKKEIAENKQANVSTDGKMPRPTRSQLTKQVVTLFQNGKSSTEIASILNIALAEVELMLSLGDLKI